MEKYMFLFRGGDPSKLSPHSALLNIKGLEETHLYHAALGDFYKEIKDFRNSRKAYDKAISFTVSKQEKDLLERKKTSLT